jgi:ribosome-associated heat shock protein Hsp15
VQIPLRNDPGIDTIESRYQEFLKRMAESVTDSVRIDKWLWAARFFKTRTLAAHAVDGGKVRVNAERVKPARTVRIGDLIDIDNGATLWQVTVRGIADARGSAAVAQALYAETEQSVIKRQLTADRNRFFREPGAALKGRPTKRDRRQIDKSTS